MEDQAAKILDKIKAHQLQYPIICPPLVLFSLVVKFFQWFTWGCTLIRCICA